MRLVLHPKVWSDVDEIIRYYETVAPHGLAEEFYDELRRTMEAAAMHPTSYAVRERELRRVNLARFPYHLLFRIVDDAVRILVVRHHRRDPSFGRGRR